MQLSEVILYVQDMDAQVCFWRDVMGLRVTWPVDRGSYRGEHWVTLDSGPCTLCLHYGSLGTSCVP